MVGAFDGHWLVRLDRMKHKLPNQKQTYLLVNSGGLNTVESTMAFTLSSHDEIHSLPSEPAFFADEALPVVSLTRTAA